MYEFRSSRYRLYPNQTQAEQFRQLCGASRYVYNTLHLVETAGDPSRHLSWNLPRLDSG